MKKDIIRLVGFTSIAQLITFLGSIILARIYSPEQYGFLALFLAIAMILSTLSYGKYDNAIIITKENKTASELLKIVIYISGFFSLILIIIVSTIILAYSELNRVYLFLPLIVFLISVNNVFDKYNNRRKSYKLMGGQRIVKSLFDVSASFIAITYFDIYYGLIIGLLLGFFSSSVLMVYMNRVDLVSVEKLNFGKTKNLLFLYRNFPIYTMPHALLNTFSANALILLIPILYGSYVLGLYAFGLKLVQAPISLFSNGFYNVFNREMAQLKSNGQSVKPFFVQNLKKLSILSIPLLIILSFSADIFFIILGEKWREAGEYIEIIAPMLIFHFMASPFASIPHLYSQQKKAFIIEIISTVLKLMIILIGSLYFEFYMVLILLSVASCFIVLYTLIWYLTILNAVKTKL